MEEVKCRNCKFWNKDEDYPEIGVCNNTITLSEYIRNNERGVINFYAIIRVGQEPIFTASYNSCLYGEQC